MRMWIVCAVVLLGSSAEAKPVVKDACEGMKPAACADAAAKRDDKQAAAMYWSACVNGKLASACLDVAELGERGGLDETGLITAYREACTLGDQSGCFLLATELRDFDSKGSRAEAIEIYTKLCDAKMGEACYALGDMSPRGKERVSWYRRACEGGDDRGCGMLAKIYFRDEDPDADAAASTKMLETMCNGGDMTACGFAADRHFSGKGTKDKGHAGADPWMIKACDLGDLHTCTARGRGMLVDAKTPAERATARRMLKKACDGGDDVACDWLERSKP
jgi:TPR repeat protein